MKNLKHKNFTKLIELLKKRDFISHTKVPFDKGNEGSITAYGPLGTFLRQRILKQWWETMVLQQDNVYPVENSPIQPVASLDTNGLKIENGQQSGCICVRDSLHQDCMSKYLHVLKLTNGHLPFSVASAGFCYSHPESVTHESEEKEFLLGGSTRKKLLLQNYTAPSRTNRVFDYWLQVRLSWWKKFSKNPSNFKVMSTSHKENSQSTDETSPTDTHQSQMSVIYEFPWGQEPIETVHNLGVSWLTSDSSEYLGKLSGDKKCLPHLIECSTSIEMATAAWLVDGYHERRPISTSKRQNSARTNAVLQLHPQIAPYQVCIARVASSSSSYCHEIRSVCSHLEKELRNAGVGVFNASEHGGTLDAHFTRNDQLGIPYTVVLNENTLRDGTVSVRNRDTELKITSHISRVVEEVDKNLRAQLE